MNHMEMTMGIYHCTYVAYGVRVEDTPPDVMEEMTFNEEPLPEGQCEWQTPDRVGFLHAGDYDEDMTFLTTFCESADLGSYKRIHAMATTEKMAEWDEKIWWAVKQNGLTPAGEPGWFVVADAS